jgi:DNA polymerase III sliding clamp (beta) subunit (PCNA family)
MSKEVIKLDFPFVDLDRNLLVKKIRMVHSVVGGKIVIPITENIRFDFKKELKAVYLTGTSLRDTIITKIDIDTLDFDAVALVNCGDFLKIIETLTDPMLKIKSDGENFLFKSANSSFKLPLCRDVNEFPKNPKMSKEKKTFVVDASKMNGILKNVYKFTAPDSDVDAKLKTVQFSIEDGNFIIGATDKYVAVIKGFKVESGEDFKPILVPKESVPVILRIIEKENVEISFDDNRICFTIDDTKLYSALSTEKPVNMKIIQGIIDRQDCGIIIDKSSMVSILKTLATINNVCDLSFKVQNNNVIASFISDNNEKKQKSKIDNLVTFLKNDTKVIETTLCFNINFCLQALGLIDGDMLIISFVDNPSNNSIRLYSEEDSDKDSAILIMKIIR